jgi:hypothetical protein
MDNSAGLPPLEQLEMSTPTQTLAPIHDDDGTAADGLDADGTAGGPAANANDTVAAPVNWMLPPPPPPPAPQQQQAPPMDDVLPVEAGQQDQEEEVEAQEEEEEEVMLANYFPNPNE